MMTLITRKTNLKNGFWNLPITVITPKLFRLYQQLLEHFHLS